MKKVKGHTLIKFNRALSVLLVAAMVAGMAPETALTAYAAEDSQSKALTTDGTGASETGEPDADVTDGEQIEADEPDADVTDGNQVEADEPDADVTDGEQVEADKPDTDVSGDDQNGSDKSGQQKQGGEAEEDKEPDSENTGNILRKEGEEPQAGEETEAEENVEKLADEETAEGFKVTFTKAGETAEIGTITVGENEVSFDNGKVTAETQVEAADGKATVTFTIAAAANYDYEVMLLTVIRQSRQRQRLLNLKYRYFL